MNLVNFQDNVYFLDWVGIMTKNPSVELEVNGTIKTNKLLADNLRNKKCGLHQAIVGFNDSGDVICETIYEYFWKYDGWGTCQGACETNGNKFRNVWCEREDGIVVDNEFCVNGANTTQPDPSQTCWTGSCCVAGSKTISSTGSYSYTVPSGCTTVSLVLFGAGGSGAWGGGYTRSQGGKITLSYNTGGDLTTISGILGTKPECTGTYSGYTSTNNGGYPGGGAGGDGGYRFGCGGGGYSSVLINSILVGKAGGEAGGTHYNKNFYLTNSYSGGCPGSDGGRGSGGGGAGGKGSSGGGGGGGSCSGDTGSCGSYPRGGANFLNTSNPGIISSQSYCGGGNGNGHITINYGP